MRINIRLTEAHILEGEQGEGEKCAIALAVRDVFPNAHIGSEVIWPIGQKDKEGIYINQYDPRNIELPEEAQLFIKRFDNGPGDPSMRSAYVQPITFNIEVSDEVLEFIQLPDLEKLVEESSCLKLVV